MRNHRDPYPFHHQPKVATGYRPAPLVPRKSNRRVLGSIVGYCFAVSTAALAVVGFFAH